MYNISCEQCGKRTENCKCLPGFPDAVDPGDIYGPKDKMKIEDIKLNLDCYELANLLNDLKPGDKGYNDSRLAAAAADEMRKAGWVFVGYNEFGLEVWGPCQATQ